MGPPWGDLPAAGKVMYELNDEEEGCPRGATKVILERIGVERAPPTYDVIEVRGKEGEVRGCVRLSWGAGTRITLDPRESHPESWGGGIAALEELVRRGCVRWLHVGLGEKGLGKGLTG